MEKIWDIYETAKMIGISVGRIKYHMEFHGLRSPENTVGGRMVFTIADVERVRSYFEGRPRYTRANQKEKVPE